MTDELVFGGVDGSSAFIPGLGVGRVIEGAGVFVPFAEEKILVAN